ncbi:hypothetical protein BH10PSE16_BH10PSE16_01910 [soil metagenome]
METNLNGVYKKSTQGWDALKIHNSGLDAAARSTLILINGIDSLAALERKLGRDIKPPVIRLLALGLVERLEAAKPPRTAASGRALPDSGEQKARWNAVRRQVAICLAPYFGPDLMTVLAPLMKADTHERFAAALHALEAKLAIYQGKKAAAKLMEGLKP